MHLLSFYYYFIDTHFTFIFSLYTWQSTYIHPLTFCAMKKIFHMYHETSVYRTKKHPSKNRNKLAISIGYLGVHEQLSQKRGSLKSTKFPFRYLRCILLFKSYPILNCALGGEAREKTFDPPCFIRVSHRLGKQNDSAQSLPVVVLYLPPCWKKQRIDNNRRG